MGNAALRYELRGAESPEKTQCDSISQSEENGLRASLYRIRFDECRAIKGRIFSETHGFLDKSLDTYSCCFIIARNNGRVLLDIHGNPAVFNSQSDAERWLMPDERVEPFRSVQSSRREGAL